ncbi:unnamed protein product, partial [Ectocarpus sp. 13 AM-2016]
LLIAARSGSSESHDSCSKGEVQRSQQRLHRHQQKHRCMKGTYINTRSATTGRQTEARQKTSHTQQLQQARHWSGSVRTSHLSYTERGSRGPTALQPPTYQVYRTGTRSTSEHGFRKDMTRAFDF